MSRTRIVSLVLVNWKGVFYERYLLDPNVTALEGANGAGKTTVMIAAYVALLPDMSRLRFTNVGESGAPRGDRGIWGRLGESGRPSYTLLELCLGDGTRVIAGVRLLKKAEPTVEPTPFIIENIPEGVPLQELLLVSDGVDEHVPQLAELRETIQKNGATLTVSRSVKEYFSTLFELGVTPLRLVGEEDRNKFNDMLRTSMTGGISKTLTSELRSFVLKKESGIADTLTRMRANLDSCRRSRGEVIDARRLQREISGVYDAGSAFFANLVLAVREEAEERRRAFGVSKENLTIVERGHRDLESAVLGHRARQEQVQTRQAAARASLQQAKVTEERRQRAMVMEAELASRDEELAVLSATAREFELSMQTCEQERETCQTRREAAQDAYDRAAGGLAKLQDGLDELHRRARDYRQVHRNLEVCREILNRPELTAGDCSSVLSETTRESEEIDSQRARLERDSQMLSLRRSEYREALDALACIESTARLPTSGDDMHHRARIALAELERRSTRLRGLAEMQKERSDLAAFTARQNAIRERAAQLGLESGKVGSADALAARLELAETQWTREDDQGRHHQNVGSDRQREHTSLQSSVAAMELRTARFTKVTEAAARIEDYVGTPPSKSSTDLVLIERGFAQEHALLVAARAVWTNEREEFLQSALNLDGGGGRISSELLRIRDQLSGELVAGRFEELSVPDAAQLEAQLGPLAHAIIVDDISKAAELLEESDQPLGETVWLVEAGTPLDSLAGQLSVGACVVVQESVGVRITPVPDHPTLGRSARSKAAERARDSARSLGEKLETSLRELHHLETLRRDVGVLRDSLEVYSAGDPSEDRRRQEEHGATLLEAIEEHREQASNARERADGLRKEVDALRRILGEGFFLDPPNYQEQGETLDEEIITVKDFDELLLGLGDSRNTLSMYMDALRHTPPDEATAAAALQKITECETRRDTLWKAREALTEVLGNRHALDWNDASETLDQRSNLVPALEEQHQTARTTMREAGEAVTKAEQAWTGATKCWQAADARMVASEMMRERLAIDLADVRPPTTETPTTETDEQNEDQQSTVAAAERRLTALEAELLDVVESGARDRERLLRSKGHLAAAAAAVKNEEVVCAPAEQAWNLLKQRCEKYGLLSAVLGGYSESTELLSSKSKVSRSSMQLLADAQGKKDVLLDRLGQATGGAELREQIASLSAGTASESTIDTWLELRDWMRRRVPAQIAEEEDPLVALDRLREHLAVLESRLGHQETDLRGASEDIARGIDVQLRRARWQVHRLNEHLENIHFGTIRSIRVHMSREERMEQILRALRDGQAQELLFQASLPFEDALNEIFSRYGGGRTGGQRLLDYREYLQLGVEIRRQSSDEWEEASPTRLSTGEAIGVGAALMMVVLTEWERDANLLRSQKRGGSLRFLFLDEANRLSKDNLAVLFDLCRNLELQLLIAAPEVAHAGDNTTYRLVRRVLESGGEEVLVSGRRAVSGSEITEDHDTNAEIPSEGGQGGVFEGEEDLV